MTTATQAALDRFVSAFTEQYAHHPHPSLPFDPEWPSECWEAENAPGTPTPWLPKPITQTTDMLERLAQALEVTLHPSIVDFYTRYWSDPLPARHAEGELSLLLCWNAEDLERLRSNLLGHLLAKQKQRQPLTLFFACTEGDEFMTVDNGDGRVWLERPGRKPLRCLADSLTEFLDQLAPLPIQNDSEL